MADSNAAMDYAITAPHGETIHIPFQVDAQTDPYLRLRSADERRAYYADNGYIVLRGLIPQAMCAAARAAYETEVRPYTGYLYRQATANPEKHEFTEHGFVKNSMLNIQDFDRRLFPRFRSSGLDVITTATMQTAVEELLQDAGRVVQSMYFEGNPATWAHQDTYYLDGEPLGSMTAAWIALEDIHPGAGRFYVYPGSHRIDMARNGGDFDISFHHDRYKTLVIDLIKKADLQCRAPALNAGDVLFWSARTIHGSLPTQEPARSRSSITSHFIPESGRYMQFQMRARQLQLERVNDMEVHCPKNQSSFRNRAVLAAEVGFPRTFQFAKRVAVKALTR